MTTDTTAQSSGCPGRSASGLNAMALAVSAPPKINVQVSPASAQPGTPVMVSGSFSADAKMMPLVRVLIDECGTTRGLAEAPVGPDGKFSVNTMLPLDSSPGSHGIFIVGGGSSNPSDNLDPPLGETVVSVIPHFPTTLRVELSKEISSGNFVPADKVEVFLQNDFIYQLKQLENPGGVTPYTGKVGSGFTNAQGWIKFEVKPIHCYNILVDPFGKTGYKFESATACLKPDEYLTVTIKGYLPGFIEICNSYKAKGKAPKMYASRRRPGTGPNFGTFISGVNFPNTIGVSLPFSKEGVKKVELKIAGKVIAAKLNNSFGTESSWGASGVNMGEFNPGTYNVSVNVVSGTDVQCEFAPGATFKMIAAPWTNKPWITGKGISVVGPPDYPVWGYKFAAELPNPALALPLPNVDLSPLHVFKNEATAKVQNFEQLFFIDETSKSSIPKLDLYVKLMDQVLLNKSYSYTPVYVGGAIDHYKFGESFTTTLGPFTIYQNGPGILCFDFCCYPCFPDGICCDCSVCGGYKIWVDLKFTAGVNLGSKINKDLSLDFDVVPNAGATLGGHFKAKAGVGLPGIGDIGCSADANVTGTGKIYLPIHYQSAPSASFDFKSACVSLSGSADANLGCVGLSLGAGGNIGPYWWPGKCTPGLEAFQSLDVSTGENSLGTEPNPAVAADDAGHALALWIQGEGTTPGQVAPFVYYSFFDGRSWSPGRRVTPAAAMVFEPQVAFLDGSRAVAVWIQNRKPLTELLAGTKPNLPDLDLYYAVWDGRAWSAPAPITNDDTLDAAPVLATDKKNGRVMAAWARRLGAPANDSTKNIVAIVSSVYDGRSWGAPAPINVDQKAIDSVVSLKFDSNGNAWAVWQRDADGDATTYRDRQLLLARWDGRVWGAPEMIPGLPAGAFAPSLALDKDNQPLVVFTVPPTDQDGNPTSGVGNRSTLWSAFKRSDKWEVGQVLRNTYAELPLVAINSDNQAVTVFRRFSDDASNGQYGELAAATADLSQPTIRWSRGFLTNDGQSNWQTAFDIDRSTSQHFVVNVKQSPFGNTFNPGMSVVAASLRQGPIESVDFTYTATAGPAVAMMTIPYATDLAITTEDIGFSNPHPIAGEATMITASIRNAGLKTTPISTPFTVKFYDGDPASGRATLVGEQRVDEPIPFNNLKQVSVPYTVQQGRMHTITVVVDQENAISETDKRNNVARATFGQPPAPMELEVTPKTEDKVLSLQWTAPNTSGIDYFLIYRTTTQGTNYELVGNTLRTSFADTLVQPGVTYYYVIIAVDVYGVRSGLSNEASGEL